MSRVWFTTPSVEFSTGTTPNAASSRSTARKTSRMLGFGSVRAADPKTRRQAWWVKVASGPK